MVNFRCKELKLICVAFQFSNLILAKPNITTRPKQPEPATKGDMIQLQCLAHGTPKPEIIWVKKNSGRAVIGSNFILESALPEDSGIWTCRASNLMGTDTADVEIVVASEWFYIQVRTSFHPEFFLKGEVRRRPIDPPACWDIHSCTLVFFLCLQWRWKESLLILNRHSSFFFLIIMQFACFNQNERKWQRATFDCTSNCLDWTCE